MNKSELCYRIFKEDAEKYDLNMDEFVEKRRNGLMPFYTPNGTIEWYKREDFRIAAVIKRPKRRKKIYTSKSTKRNHREQSENRGVRLLQLLIIGVSLASIVYLLEKLL